jgi:hypothetical protein
MVVALALPAIAQEVQLADLPNVLPNSPALIKSLGDAAEYVLRWQPPVDAEAWRKRRPEVERAFRTAIGLDPPDIVALLAPRKTLFCQASDTRSPAAESLITRFERVTGAVGQGSTTYAPRRSLDGALLLQWMGK